MLSNVFRSGGRIIFGICNTHELALDVRGTIGGNWVGMDCISSSLGSNIVPRVRCLADVLMKVLLRWDVQTRCERDWCENFMPIICLPLVGQVDLVNQHASCGNSLELLTITSKQ